MYFKGPWNGDLTVKDSTFSTEDILSPLDNLTGFNLSLTKLIVWSKTQIYYLDLLTLKLKKISLSIRAKDVDSYIKSVDVSGIREDRCAITMS